MLPLPSGPVPANRGSDEISVLSGLFISLWGRGVMEENQQAHCTLSDSSFWGQPWPSPTPLLPMGLQNTSSHLPVCLHHWALEFFKSSINLSWPDSSPLPYSFPSLMHPSIYPSIIPPSLHLSSHPFIFVPPQPFTGPGTGKLSVNSNHHHFI